LKEAITTEEGLAVPEKKNDDETTAAPSESRLNRSK
jgi:hypothetical protein